MWWLRALVEEGELNRMKSKCSFPKLHRSTDSWLRESDDWSRYTYHHAIAFLGE